MADKKEKNYYELKSDAVDRLVNANAENSPKVTDEEIAKVSGRKKKFAIPDVVKALFIKWWFNGAICFFFYFGLGSILEDTYDQLFILGAALGILTDLLTNHLLHFIEKRDGQYDKYMMVTTKKFWSLLINIVYAYLVLYCVYNVYSMVNAAINQGKGTVSEVYLPVEPILFGLLFLIFDLIFIAVKNGLMHVVNDAKKTAGNNKK